MSTDDTEAGTFAHLQTSVADAGVQVPVGVPNSVFSPSVADLAVARSTEPLTPVSLSGLPRMHAVMRLLCALGSITAADLREHTDWTTKKVHNTLCSMKTLGLIAPQQPGVMPATFVLTDKGRAWPGSRQEITGAPPARPTGMPVGRAPGASYRHAGPPPDAVPAAPTPFKRWLQTQADEGAPRPPEGRPRGRRNRAAPEPVDGFRCALFDDGCLRLEIDGQPAELNRERTQRLIAYLDLVRGAGVYRPT